MGVKSTAYISRGEAIRRAVDHELERRRHKLEARFGAMSDTSLENLVEELNDEARGGEGFENYIITENPEDFEP